MVWPERTKPGTWTGDKMDTAEIVKLCKEHTLFTWSATGGVDPLPIERAEGIYLYTTDGKQVIDFNSQLMSVHIGHVTYGQRRCAHAPMGRILGNCDIARQNALRDSSDRPQ